MADPIAIGQRTILVVCPTCDGTGSGDGFGMAGAGGGCVDCRMTGEVLPSKRERLEARRAARQGA